MERAAARRFRPTEDETAALALLAAANIALNRLLRKEFHVPASLATVGAMLLLSRHSGATTDNLGLARQSVPRGLKTGLLIGIPVAAAAAAGAFVPLTGRFFRDERIIRAGDQAALYELFVRMPLATAAGEELLFRGALEATLRRQRSPLRAVVAASALFGIWHALPTFDRLRSNPGVRSVHNDNLVAKLAVVAGTCCATAGAGLALSWLRQKSGSILAPVIVHYAINGGAFAGGWLAFRQADRSGRARIEPLP